MLRRSELAIIKDGVLTLNGYSFSMIYKMLGICTNPGKYLLGKDSKGHDAYLVSNGSEVWMTNDSDSITIGHSKSKEELTYILGRLEDSLKNSTRYYEVCNILYREYKDKLYYLTPIKNIEDDTIYAENSIPLVVIFKVLKADFPTKNSRQAMIFSGRLDSIKRESVTKDYLDSYLDYFGYTKVDDYYVLLTFDDVVRIDTVEDGQYKCLKTTLDCLKEVIIL